jgi:hypothetical protein
MAVYAKTSLLRIGFGSRLPKITADTRWEWLRSFRINSARLKIELQNKKLKRRPIEREPNEPSNGCTKFTPRWKIDFFGRVRIAAARTVYPQGPQATRRHCRFEEETECDRNYFKSGTLRKHKCCAFS